MTSHENIAATAIVDPSALIGHGTKVWNFCHIMRGAEIGDYCSVGSFSEIGTESRIGDRSRISAHVFLPPRTKIGMNVFIGPGVICTDDLYPVVSLASGHYDAKPPTIGDFASIGAGAVLCPGVRIGARARIAAGARVTKDVAPGECVKCEPARPHQLSPKATEAWR